MLKENKDDIEEFLFNYSKEIKTLLDTNNSAFKVNDSIIQVEITKEKIKDEKD